MKRRKKDFSPFLIIGLGVAVLLGAVWAVMGTLRPGSSPASSGQEQSRPVSSVSSAVQQTPLPQIPTGDWRAVWLSYLEYQQMDFSTEEAFTGEIEKIFDNIVASGCNTVLAQVRPCGDALYESEIFPWSHFITGVQGQNPGYDPLAVMVQAAHARGLRIEAWVNPYRVRMSSKAPETLSAENPAAVWMADSAVQRVLEVDGSLWYNPALPETRQLVADGVAELCQKYEIDGIHFDDYFYPTTDTAFDEQSFALYGDGQELDSWRRANVDALVQQVAEVVKASGKDITFGISPQGNNDNNYSQQYSDVANWMQNGWVDYVCPQIYWGFDYRTASGSERFAFEPCLAEWLGIPRAEKVKLYVGLGAFRISEGDGSSAQSQEWQSGQNVAKQVMALRAAGADGYGIYRYDSLFQNTELAKAELAALTAVN